MASAFDPRIVQVTMVFPDQTITLENLAIYATGQKFGSATMNSCHCKIFNLTKDQRNYIASQTSPIKLNRQPVQFNLDIGRQSYGTFRLFSGQVITSDVTQPPDIGITLNSLTDSFAIGQITANTQSSVTQLSVIAKNIATNLGKTLNFKATDKQIENFAYNGSTIYQLRALNNMGGVVAYIDNEVLNVLDAGQPNKPGTRILNASNGMVGIPQLDWSGVTVKMMADNTVQLGNMITLQSLELPAANGDYVIWNLTYDIASRDQAFYYTLACKPLAYFAGTLG